MLPSGDSPPRYEYDPNEVSPERSPDHVTVSLTMRLCSSGRICEAQLDSWEQRTSERMATRPNLSGLATVRWRGHTHTADVEGQLSLEQPPAYTMNAGSCLGRAVKRMLAYPALGRTSTRQDQFCHATCFPQFLWACSIASAAIIATA